MDGANLVAQSIDAVNRILQIATRENMEFAKKMIATEVEMNVGRELGKGRSIDAAG